MQKQSITVPNIYAPTNGAHAFKADNAFYTGAALPFDKDGKLVGLGDVIAQSEQVFANLDLILQASQVRWSDVFKVHIYVAPRQDHARLKRAYLARDRYLPPGQQVGVIACMGQARPDILISVEVFAYVGARKQALAGIAGTATGSGWADAVTIEGRFFVSAQLPITPAEASRANEAGHPFSVKGDMNVQAGAVYDHLNTIVKAAGVDWSKVLKVRQYITQPQVDFDAIRHARNRYMALGKFTSTSVGCHEPHSEWLLKDWLLQVEMEASLVDTAYINVPGLPQNPDGPQPHAMKAGKTVHVHGMVPWASDLTTLHEGNIKAQAEVVYGHLSGILKGAGLNWSNVVHARTFCVEQAHFPVVRQVQKEFLGEVPFPNTELVATMYAHDGKALLEVDVMAVSF